MTLSRILSANTEKEVREVDEYIKSLTLGEVLSLKGMLMMTEVDVREKLEALEERGDDEAIKLKEELKVYYMRLSFLFNHLQGIYLRKMQERGDC